MLTWLLLQITPFKAFWPSCQIYRPSSMLEWRLKCWQQKKLLYSIFFSSYSYLSSALKNNDGMAILMLNAYHSILFSSDIRMRICSLMSKKAEVTLWRGRNTNVITLTTEMFKENPIISHFHRLFKPTHMQKERWRDATLCGHLYTAKTLSNVSAISFSVFG